MTTFIVNIPGGRIGSFLAGAAVASVLSGVALAVTSTDFTYSAAKTGYFTIDPMGVTPSNDETDYTVWYSSDLGGYVESSGSSSVPSGCLQANVNLPQGAIVRNVTTWYRSGSKSNPGIFFERHNLTSGAVQDLGYAVVADNDYVRKAKTIAVPANVSVINNAAFSYGYGICIGVSSNFFGARINYTY